MTDKILIDRSLLQQALDALVSETSPEWECNSYHPKVYPAMTTIREALAAPQRQPVQQCWKCGDADPAFQARCGVPACGMLELPQPAQTELSAPDSASVDALEAPQPLFTGLIAQHPGLAAELAAQEPACPVCQRAPEFRLDRRSGEWDGLCKHCGVCGSAALTEKEAKQKWIDWHHKAPQPAQPYGWTVVGCSSIYRGDYAEQDAKSEAWHIGGTAQAIALFEAPQPQRQPLTVGEIHTAYGTAANQTLRPQDEKIVIAFARAIEAHITKGAP